jgi:hypothetical protein
MKNHFEVLPKTSNLNLMDSEQKASSGHMTIAMKAELHSLVCRHAHLELEVTDSGYLTGHHQCIDCGEIIASRKSQQ